MLALTFQVGADRVAIDVRRVRRVVPLVRLSAAPAEVPALAGVFVYRGQVVPVVDLFRLAGAGTCPTQLSSRIILVPYPRGTDGLVGLLASQVADIRELSTPDAPYRTTAQGLGPPLPDGAAVIRLLDASQLLDSLALETVLSIRPGAEA